MRCCAESLLNTPLFVGFPGFVSKLWLAHDENGAYRGFYQWNGAQLADAYVRALWWVLALVSVRSSIHYVVLPGLRRDDVLADPTILERCGVRIPARVVAIRSGGAAETVTHRRDVGRGCLDPPSALRPDAVIECEGARAALEVVALGACARVHRET